MSEAQLKTKNPAKFGYYSAKELLTPEGELLQCPNCPAQELEKEVDGKVVKYMGWKPIDYEKKTAQTGTKMFTWKCPDCGFGTAAFIKAKCEFSLKANLIENCAKGGVGLQELVDYMKKYRLGNIPKKIMDEYYEGETVTKKRKESPDDSPSSSAEPPRKKQALGSDSASDLLSQILEHVKVIKEINEVQKNELKDLIVAVKLQGANALESTTKVVDLLQENSFKLNNLATPPKIEDTMTEEDEARLKALFDSDEICGTMDVIDENSIQLIPPTKSVTKRAKTIKPRQNSK